MYSFDVSNPRAPELMAHYPELDCRGLHVRGGLAYIACDRGLVVTDVSTPSSMRPVSSWEGSGLWLLEPLAETDSIAVLQIGDSPRNELVMLDIADASIPRLLSRHSFPSSQSLAAMVSDGRSLILGDPLQVVDVADTSRPTVVQTVTRVGVRSLSLSDTYLFAGTYAGLTVYHIDELTDYVNPRVMLPAVLSSGPRP